MAIPDQAPERINFLNRQACGHHSAGLRTAQSPRFIFPIEQYYPFLYDYGSEIRANAIALQMGCLGLYSLVEFMYNTDALITLANQHTRWFFRIVGMKSTQANNAATNELLVVFFSIEQLTSYAPVQLDRPSMIAEELYHCTIRNKHTP